MRERLLPHRSRWSLLAQIATCSAKLLALVAVSTAERSSQNMEPVGCSETIADNRLHEDLGPVVSRNGRR